MENNDNAPVKFDEAQRNTIRNSVAKGASEADFNMFIALASRYDLDPFAHEIWCICMNGQTIITTARDGYLKIANRNPHFRGMESDVVYSGDKFFKDNDGVHHAYNVSNRGQIIGAYAVVYRDDRDKPAYAFAPMKDYNKGRGTWTQYPHAMILKVAEAMALKRAFSVSGLVAYEEIDSAQPREHVQASKYTTQERDIQIRQLWQRYLDVCGHQKNHAINAMKKVTGKDKSSEYTDEDLRKLFEDVREREFAAMDQEVQQQQQQVPSDIQDADFQEVQEQQ